MNTSGTYHGAWRDWISPLRITLLAINAVCFGACLVLLAIGRASGPLVFLTIAIGLSFGAGFTGAIVASRKVLAATREGDTDRRDREPGTRVPGGSQPIRSESNGTSTAAGSRR